MAASLHAYLYFESHVRKIAHNFSYVIQNSGFLLTRRPLDCIIQSSCSLLLQATWFCVITTWVGLQHDREHVPNSWLGNLWRIMYKHAVISMQWSHHFTHDRWMRKTKALANLLSIERGSILVSVFYFLINDRGSIFNNFYYY